MTQPVDSIRPMEDLLDDTLRPQRFSALTFALFAAVALALAVGTAAALASAAVVKHIAFGISAPDPVTLVSVGALLAFVALLASLISAWRAARVDPLTVLRSN